MNVFVEVFILVLNDIFQIKCSLYYLYFKYHLKRDFSINLTVLITIVENNVVLFFLTVEYIVKSRVRTIFVFEFKLDRKATETACNINEAFSPRSPVDFERSYRPLDVDNNISRVLVKANLYTTYDF